MTVLLLLLLISVSVCVMAVAPVLYRLLRSTSPSEITPEWRERFSVSNYVPMRSLLEQEDFRFVVRQPGFDLSLYRKFRRERLQTYRFYLRCLISDFNRLHTIAKLLVAQSECDNSAIALHLIALRMRFAATVLHAEMNCALWYLGMPALFAHRMIGLLEEMAIEVQNLSLTQISSQRA